MTSETVTKMLLLTADHPGIIEAARRIQSYWNPLQSSCLPPHTRSGVPVARIAQVIADAMNEHASGDKKHSPAPKSLTPEEMGIIISCLQELRGLLDGESGAYLGIYDEPAAKICEVMGWEHTKT